MTTTDVNPGTRLAGALLLISFVAMVAGAAVVAPSGLTLNPTDPVATLTTVRDHVGLHVTGLALDVVGWLALTAAGLVVAGGHGAMRGHLAGLLWVAATIATTAGLPGPRSLRWAGAVAAASGSASVLLPWTTATATAGVSPQLEQLGYALYLPVMLWYAVLGWRCLRHR